MASRGRGLGRGLGRGPAAGGGLGGVSAVAPGTSFLAHALSHGKAPTDRLPGAGLSPDQPTQPASTSTPPQAEAEKRHSSGDEESKTDSVTLARTVSEEQAEQRLRDLEEANRLGQAVCPVCLEAVDVSAAIWSCGACWQPFHLQCIQSWARSCQSRSKVQELRELFPDMEVDWYCPTCRRAFPSSTHAPTEYRCFCSKELNPRVDRWLAPHSCGQVCGRELASRCGHACTLLCHPGPCPPCPQLVDASCFCGQTVERRRCSRRAYACDKPCSRVLPCGMHRCPAPCHAGDCPPCTRSSAQRCRCGRKEETRLCSQHDFQCGEPCGKPLACGRHRCVAICHRGPCAPCALNGPRTCPCGKEKQEMPCDVPVRTCGDTCDKALSCGHACQERCHEGPCPPCRQMISKECECGKARKLAMCSAEYRCERLCPLMRNCQRHPCKKRCCKGDCAPCNKTCDRRLNCGNHKCEAVCHDGGCSPCPRKVAISCNCGATTLMVACGWESRIQPPKCIMRCRKPPNCHHTLAECIPHPCHFGACPPCSAPCGKRPCNPDPLAKCDHPCGAKCHSAVAQPAASPSKALKQGGAASAWSRSPVAAKPGESARRDASVRSDDEKGGAADAAATRSAACPECRERVERQCLGGHEKLVMECSQPARFSCARPCGRLLACGQHRCEEKCHDVDTQPCRPCTRSCERPRPCSSAVNQGRRCTHSCELKTCHKGPCPPCKALTQLRCRCGLQPVALSCSELIELSDAEFETLQSCGQPCGKKLPHCSHRCPVVCHAGDCPAPDQCSKTATVRCACQRRKEEWVCARVQAEQRRQATDSLKILSCDQGCAAVAGQKIAETEAAAARERAAAEERAVAEKARLEEAQRRRKARLEAWRNRGQDDEGEPLTCRQRCERLSGAQLALGAAGATVAALVGFLAYWTLRAW